MAEVQLIVDVKRIGAGPDTKADTEALQQALHAWAGRTSGYRILKKPDVSFDPSNVAVILTLDCSQALALELQKALLVLP